jgi:hypothetical protein
MSHTAPPITDSLPVPVGVVYGQPRVWLGLEGAAVCGATVTAYATGGHSWILFALLFFLPDATFLGYLAGPRLGAYCYNAAHNYAVPVAAGILLYLLGRPLAVPLVWTAHIGFDRVMGYGLKYAGGFDQTHLGRLGRVTRQSGAT